MAEVREIVCDVKGCKVRGCFPFHVFSHNEYNGVDTERWDHVFDLCPGDTAVLCRALLKELGPEKSKVIVDSLKIVTRMG